MVVVGWAWESKQSSLPNRHDNPALHKWGTTSRVLIGLAAILPRHSIMWRETPHV